MSGASKWTTAFIETSWKDVMTGEASEAAMKETMLKYTMPSIEWTIDGKALSMDELVKSCAQLRGRIESVKIEVQNLVTEKKGNGVQLANRHISYFVRRDGSTVSNECFQIMDINKDGLVTKAVESARNFNDSSVSGGKDD